MQSSSSSSSSQSHSDIWAADVRFDGYFSPIISTKVAAATTTTPVVVAVAVPCDVAAEFARFRAVKSLRSKYARLVAEHGSKGGTTAQAATPPPLAFDRWLARSALERATSTITTTTTDNVSYAVVDNDNVENETGGSISSQEPILPTAEGTNAGLIADLNRTYSRAAAITIADALSAASRLAAEKQSAAFYNSNHKSGKNDRAAAAATTATTTAMTRSTIPPPNDTTTKITKSLVKATKRAAKRARKSSPSLKTVTNNNNESSSSSSFAAWLELERAAEALRDHAAFVAASLKPPDLLRVEKSTSRGGGIVILSALNDHHHADTANAGAKPLKPYMTINKQHYDKLTELHSRFGGAKQKNGGDNNNDNVIDSLIFCLLCRYEALKGVGSQCAVPGAAFESLQPYLGHTVECFASPLNCRYERYFSAYPVLERAFGSLGSFFSINVPDMITEGSFEANPPFVPEIMAFMEKRIHQLLSDPTKGPLSFLIIVPDWGGGSTSKNTAKSCSRSKFKRAETYIRASDHVFADGAQHRVSDRWRPSSWDTAVILLQNDKGKQKWALNTDELTAAIQGAFTRAANNGGPKTTDKEDVYAWEARGSRKGGKQGKNIPVKRDYGGHHHNKKKMRTI